MKISRNIRLNNVLSAVPNENDYATRVSSINDRLKINLK